MNSESRSILIVEDDADINRALTIRLSAEGYTVESATDAIVATQLVKEMQPDLLLLDISIPGGDGFEVARRAEKLVSGKHVKKIFITASKKPGLLKKATEANANGFVEKPFRPSELMTQIRNAFRYSEPIHSVR